MTFGLALADERVGDKKRRDREQYIPRRWRMECFVIHEAHRHFNGEIQDQRDERGDVRLFNSDCDEDPRPDGEDWDDDELPDKRVDEKHEHHPL